MHIKLDIVSYFPKMHQDYFQYSFFKNFLQNKQIELATHSILDVSKQYNLPNDKKPFGHSVGMLLSCSVVDYIITSIKHYKDKDTIIIHPSPSGNVLNTNIVKQISKYKNMIFLCSRYEGMDARIIQQFNIFEISIGDYILFDGDTSAITIYNAIIRDKMVKKTAKLNESFDNFLLEHDQFTHPKIYLNHLVPEELYGGNHKNILNWQLYNSIKKTLCKRPDLYRMYIEYMDNL